MSALSLACKQADSIDTEGNDARRSMFPILLTLGAEWLPSKEDFERYCQGMGTIEYWTRRLENRARAAALLKHRRSHEAHSDARRLLRCCVEGLPLELQRRLVLGRLPVTDDRLNELKALALSRGHSDCADLCASAAIES